ncbi:MAG: SHOCT domain-containing protein [Candidatus Bathyarchaeia archaeon]
MSDRNGAWIILAVVLVLILLVGPLVFMGGWFMGPGMMGPGMMGWRGYGYGYGLSWLGALLRILLVIIFLALIAFGIYYLVGATKPAAGGRALEILKERYAKGEISKEEYERIKQELSKGE